MPRAGHMDIDTAGLSEAGIWVRRLRTTPNLLDEALCLAGVLHLWSLSDLMTVHWFQSYYCEISGPNLQPVWIYLVEIVGTRMGDQSLIVNHPLALATDGEPVRVVALAFPGVPPMIPGALVETQEHRRMLWMQPVAT